MRWSEHDNAPEILKPGVLEYGSRDNAAHAVSHQVPFANGQLTVNREQLLSQAFGVRFNSVANTPVTPIDDPKSGSLEPSGNGDMSKRVPPRP